MAERTPARELRELRERNKELEDQVAKLDQAVQLSLTYVERGALPPAKLLRGALGFKMRWTKESLVEAVHEWVAEFGEPPKSAQWNPADERNTEEDREKFYSGDYPTVSTIRRHFPKWNMLLAAAGVDTKEPGGGAHVGPPEGYNEAWPIWTGFEHLPHLRQRLGLTQHALAHAAHCGPGMIRKLENAKLDDPKNLPNPSIRALMTLAKALGVRTAALIEGEDW